MFLHANLFHLVGNMVFLWIFACAHVDGGVAYFAHVGGFGGGVAIAALWKYVLFPASMVQRAPRMPLDHIAFIDDPAETYAVLRIRDDGAPPGRLAKAVAAE